MMRARLVAFDLDGTLIDSHLDLADAANATLGAFGRGPLPAATVAAMVGEGARVLIERAFRACDVTPPPTEALEVFLRLYEERLVVHTRPYAGIPATLAALSTHCRLAVLTNKPQHPAERLLDHFELARFFFRVIGGDTAWPRKPEPAALESLMAEAGASPSTTVLVGDSWIDHETAVRARVRCCLARYGFGFSQIPPVRLRGDELVIDRPEDLLALVNER